MTNNSSFDMPCARARKKLLEYVNERVLRSLPESEDQKKMDHLIDFTFSFPSNIKEDGSRKGVSLPDVHLWVTTLRGLSEESVYPFTCSIGKPLDIGPEFSRYNVTEWYGNLSHQDVRAYLDMHHSVLGAIYIISNDLDKYQGFGIFGRDNYDIEVLRHVTEVELKVPDVKDRKVSCHSVLIVAYGIESGKSFYVIQNSWGKEWGLNGFGRVEEHLCHNLGTINTVYKRINLDSSSSSDTECPDASTSRASGSCVSACKDQTYDRDVQSAINNSNGKWLGTRQIRCNWATKGAGTSDDKQSSDAKSVVELTNGTSESSDAPENNTQYTTVYVGNLSPEACEKKPRESILLAEFAQAIDIINGELTEEKHLKFLHWDLNKYLKDKTKNVLDSLIKVAGNALDRTGFFYSHMMPFSRTEEWLSVTRFQRDSNGDPLENASPSNPGKQSGGINSGVQFDITQYCKPLMFQQGVLRTNCIDCLDRTNVAQFCHGLVSLGNQLYAMGFTDVPKVDLDSPLAEDLMRIYEAMGDTLALQYGGSAAHNKIFSERRGQPKAVTQSQELIRTFQRYYSNAYMDPEKQNAINVFLGHLQPQLDRPDFWELDSDQHYNAQRHGLDLEMESPISTITRSLSDGNIPSGSISEENEDRCTPGIASGQSTKKVISKSKSKILTFESGGSYGRYVPPTSHRVLFIGRTGSDDIPFHEHGNQFSCSNFLDVDLLSSSGNSCEEVAFDRSALIGSSTEQSSSTIASGMKDYSSSPALESGSSIGKEQTAGDASSFSAYMRDSDVKRLDI